MPYASSGKIFGLKIFSVFVLFFTLTTGGVFALDQKSSAIKDIKNTSTSTPTFSSISDSLRGGLNTFSPRTFSLSSLTSPLASLTSRNEDVLDFFSTPVRSYTLRTLSPYTAEALTPTTTATASVPFLDRLSLTVFCSLASLTGTVEDTRCNYTMLASGLLAAPEVVTPTPTQEVPTTATSTPVLAASSAPKTIYITEYITKYVEGLPGVPGKDGADGKDAVAISPLQSQGSFGGYIYPSAPQSIQQVYVPQVVPVSTIGYLNNPTIDYALINFGTSTSQNIVSAKVRDSVFNGHQLFEDLASFTGSVTINNLTATSSVFTNATTTNAYMASSTLVDAILTNATTTNASITNLFVTSATSTTSYVSTLIAASSTLTDALLTRATTTDAYIANLIAGSSTLIDAILTNATTTNAFIANLQVSTSTAQTLTVSGTSSLATTTISSLTATNATSTTLFSTLLTALSGLFTDLIATNATTTNATSTNFFATNASFTNLNNNTSSTTNLFATNATTTNSTSTNFFASNGFITNGSSTNFFTQNLAVGNASTTGNQSIDGSFEVTGTSTLGSNVFLNGSVTIGTSTSNTLTINGLVNSNIVPAQNITYDLGSPSFYWRNLYADNINVNSISAASTTISGTSNDTFSINSDNGSSDAQDSSLVFFRGLVTPNALFRWNATTKRLESNMSFKVQNETPITGTTTLTVQAGAGQGTTNLLEVKNNAGTNLTVIDAQGRLGIGSSTPGSALTVIGNTSLGGNLTATGTLNVTGQTILTTASSTALTTTSLFATNSTTTNATSTNFFATLLSAVTALFTNLSTTGTTTLATTGGNVGVGTSTPGNTLTVQGGISLANITTGAATSFSVNSTGGLTTTSAGGYTVNASNGNSINFSQSGVSRLMIDTGGGNIGIGTTTPGSLLSVQGNAYFGGNIIATGTLAVTGQTTLTTASSTGLTATNLYATNSTITNATSTNLFTSLLNAVTAAFTTLTTTGTTTLATTGGNVGVGTTTPGSKLTVVGTSSLVGNVQVGGSTGTANVDILDSVADSNFALRATSPAGFIGLMSMSGAGTWNPLVGSNDKSIIFSSSTQDTGNLVIGPWSASSKGIKIVGATGNIGIGTSTPGSLLSVQGNAYFGGDVVATGTLNVTGQTTLTTASSTALTTTSLFATNSTTTNATSTNFFATLLSAVTALFTNLSTTGTTTLATTGGNVGVGTTTPGAKLHVDGGAFLLTNSGQAAATIRSISSAGSAVFPQLSIENYSNDTGFPVVELVQSRGTSTSPLSVVAGDVLGGFNTWGNNGTLRQSATRIQGLAETTFSSSVGAALQFFTTTGGSQSEKMRITGSGNVGIGTTTPTSPFVVYGAGNYGQVDVVSSAANGEAGLLFKSADDTDGSGWLIGKNLNLTDDSFGIFRGGNLFTISTNGNVGIGTTTPSAKLTVSPYQSSIGTLTNGASSFIVGNGTALGTATSSYLYPQELQSSTGNTVRLQTTFYRRIAGSDWNGSAYRLQYAVDNSFTTGSKAYIEVGAGDPSVTGGGFLALGTAGSDRLVVNNTGNVGIGTTTPSRVLEIAGSNTDTLGIRIGVAGTGSAENYDLYRKSSDGVFQFVSNQSGAGGFNWFTNSGSGTTSRMLITNGGNIGIGTTTPTYKLDVIGAGRFTTGATQLYLGSTANNGQIQLSRASDGAMNGYIGYGWNSQTADGPLVITDANGAGEVRLNAYASDGIVSFYQNNAEKMRIHTNGNVGIGTTTPTAQLAVKGNGTGIALIGDSGFTNFAGISLNGTLSGTDYNFTSGVVDKNLYINRPGGNEIVFREANGTNNLIIKSGGNVGIGTTTPEGLLHVNSPSGQIVFTPSGSGTETTDNIGLEIRASAYVNGPYASRFVKADEGGGIPLYIQNNESGNGTTWVNNARFGSYSGNDNKFETFGQTALATAGGNVGIGIAAPGAKLTVYQDQDAISYLDYYNTTIGSSAAVYLRQITQNAAGSGNIASGLLKYRTGELRLINGETTSTGFSTIYTAGSERVRISSTGNVGIGTNNPTTRLNVSGGTLLVNTPTGDQNSIYIDGGTTNRITFGPGATASRIGISGVANFINMNTTGELSIAPKAGSNMEIQLASGGELGITGGNVGIGTTNPGYKLDVDGTIRNAGYFIGVDTLGAGNIQYLLANDGGSSFINSGNFGLGTSTPSYKLDVVGTLRNSGNFVLAGGLLDGTGTTITSNANAFNVNSSNILLGNNSTDAVNLADGTMYLSGNGNVGIGTTTAGNKLTVSGTTTLVGSATGPTALKVIGNIDNIANGTVAPTVVGSLTTGLSPRSVAVSGRYAYVTNHNANTLQVIDISTNTPAVIGSVTTGTNPNAVVVSGNYAYVLNYGSHSLQVVDISTPSRPSVVSTFTVGTNPHGLAISGKYVYLVNSESATLQIVDISNPSSPLTVGSVGTGAYPFSVAVSGRYAYVTNHTAGAVQVVDVLNPASPIIVGTVSTGSEPRHVAVSGKYAYVANLGSGNVKVLDVSSSTAPTVVGTVTTGDQPIYVGVSGRYLYVLTALSNTLQVVDVIAPTNPTTVSTLTTGTVPRSVAISGRYAYVVSSTSNLLQTIDVGGLETTSANIHSLEAGQMQVREDLKVQGGIFTQALNAVSAYVENLSAKVLSLSSLALGAASNVATNALLSLNLATSGTELVTKNSATGFTVSGYATTTGVALNPAAQGGGIMLNLASTTSVGSGVFTTGPTLPQSFGVGSFSLQRPDGRLLLLVGAGSANTYLYDPVANTFTGFGVNPALASGSIGAGAHAIQRPDGKFLIINGGAANTTNIYDPVANTFTAGPSLSTGTAGLGSHSIQRPDGRYLVINANSSSATNIYDPAANTFSAGPSLASGTAAQGSHSIQRPDGKFVVVIGGGNNITNLYDPVANTFAVGPSLGNFSYDGSHSIQRPDGKFVLFAGAGNAGTEIYDPIANTFVAGPSVSVGVNDGGHSIQRPDGKFLVISGTSNSTSIYDPLTNTFSAGPSLSSGNANSGSHSIQRPDGKFLIVNGNSSTATNIYDASYIMTGTWESEDMNMTDLNPSSVLSYATNGEGRIIVEIKTATTQGGLASASYASSTSGMKINPVSGAVWAKTKVTFIRPVIANRQPHSGTKESKTWLGESDTKYQRSFANPILYSFNISNQKGYHVTNTDFGTNSASTTLTSNATSGPVVSGLMTGNDGLTLPYSSTNNLDLAKGVFTGGPILASGNSGIGTFSIQRPDGKYLVVNGGSTATTNILDPVTMTFTAGPSLASGTVQGGGHAIQRPDGKFLIVNGNNTTTTNVYDPIANTMSVGPAVVSGTPYYGANSLQRPDGKFLIIVGNTSTATNIYDPITNTMTAGPNLTANAYVGSFSIQRPDGKFLIIVGNTVSTTNIYDPISNTMTAGPNLASYVGWGGHAVQRPDGKIIIVHGAGLSSTTLYDPSVIDTSNTLPVGPNLYSASNYGAHAIQRPDGTYLFIAGAGNTGTSIYDPNGNTFYNGNAVVSGNIQYNSHSIHLPDGRFLVINGDGSTATNIYNAGYLVRGYYESEFINDTTLDSNSTFTWKGNADAYKSGVVSVRVRTATSTNALQTASWRTLPVSGSRINPGTSETWMQVKFEMNRPIANQSGIAKTVIKGESVYYNRFPLTTTTQNQASVFVKPTIYSYAIQKQEGQDLATFQVNGNSVFRFSATGDAYTSAGGSWNAGGADVAEYFPTEDGLLEPGDIVSVSATPDGLVTMTTESYDDRILGIVTTAPGLRLGSDDIGVNQGKQPIALAGRVPVKVSLENGVIKKGDYLTSSSRPGFAMKALDAGRVIGIALEDYTLEMDTQNNGAGKVLTFVNPHFYMGASFTEKVTSQFSRFATMIQKGVAELGVTIASNGSVGIGVADPLSKFHVAGDARLGVASTTSGRLYFQNEANGFTTVLQSASSTLTSDLVLTLPDTLGSARQALLTDGNGQMYWGNVPGLATSTEGYVPRFMASGELTTGVMLDDGQVAGVNATSTDIAFTVAQGTSTQQPLSVLSSLKETFFTVSNTGLVAIGTSTPGSRFDIVDQTDISGVNLMRVFSNVDSGSDLKFSLTSDGDLFANRSVTVGLSGGVAESYVAEEALDAGMVVAFATTTSAWEQRGATTTEAYEIASVRKANHSLEVVGVVSTLSGITLATKHASSTLNTVPVALLGRVPVKVTTENGEIKVGDYVTVSTTTPGHAMKLTGEGKAIGRAVSNYVQGRDKVLISLDMSNQKLDMAGGYATTTGMLTTGNVDLNANGVAITNIKSLASANGTWSIDENGKIIAKSLCIEGNCIDGEGLGDVIATSKRSGAVQIIGDYAYLLNVKTHSLRVLDMRDQDNPVVISTLVMAEGVATLAASGNYLYVTSDDLSMIYLVNISTPSSPVIARAIDTNGTSSVPSFIPPVDSVGEVAGTSTEETSQEVADSSTEPTVPTEVEVSEGVQPETSSSEEEAEETESTEEPAAGADGTPLVVDVPVAETP